MSARNGSSHAANLESQLASLRGINAELKNSIGLKADKMQNSLASLVQGANFQTGLNSLSNLAYFNAYAPLTINWTLLTYMYKTHGLLQTAIDMPVLDALRGGVELRSSDLDQTDLKRLYDRLQKTNAMGVASETCTWARLYGGGGIVINTEQDPATPLDVKAIRNGQRLEFYAASRWELSSTSRYSEFFNFYGKKLHASRVLTIAGKAAPYLVKFVLQGWGMSEMERMIEDFNLYLRTKDVIYELLKEAKIDVYQFENFTAQLATDAGTSITRRRVQLMNQLKAYNNAVVLDKNDVFEQKQITFAGLAEVHKQNQVYVASALRMPCTKLFGLSAAGFNSGEDDIENYNAMVESEVRTPLRPLMQQIIDLVAWQEFGMDFDLDFEYKPLRVLGEVEMETVKTSKFARYKSMYDDGLMDAQEYAGLCHSEGLIPVETSAAKTGELFENPLRQMGSEPGGSADDEPEEEDEDTDDE